jgi:hypothetical protein
MNGTVGRPGTMIPTAPKPKKHQPNRRNTGLTTNQFLPSITVIDAILQRPDDVTDTGSRGGRQLLSRPVQFWRSEPPPQSVSRGGSPAGIAAARASSRQIIRSWCCGPGYGAAEHSGVPGNAMPADTDARPAVYGRLSFCGTRIRPGRVFRERQSRQTSTRPDGDDRRILRRRSGRGPVRAPPTGWALLLVAPDAGRRLASRSDSTAEQLCSGSAKGLKKMPRHVPPVGSTRVLAARRGARRRKELRASNYCL